nr:unnamed protein product [Callosobruchus analis]
MQLWKTVYINTSYILNFILFENNHHLKSIDVQNTSSALFTTCILHMQLWKAVYINTSYILNFILLENNHHLKSIDVHNTSSPLPFLYTLIWLVPVYFLYSCGEPR